HRLLHGVEEAVALLPVTALGGVVVAQLDAGLAGQALDGLHEVEVIDLPHELDDVARRLAPEAVVQTLLGVDREGGRFLRVERAQAYPATPDLLERHVLAGHLHEVDRGLHPGHVFVHDPHGRTLARLVPLPVRAPRYPPNGGIGNYEQMGLNGQVDLRTAAEHLGVHYQTAYRWVRSGALRAVKVGTSYEVEPEEIERVKARRSLPAPPPPAA